MIDKAIVILDNFWNANYIINCGFVLFPCDKNKYYKVNLSQKDKNYTVYSIALRHPLLDEKLPYLRNLNTLSFFCPTYNMLIRYKKDDNWDNYTKDYKNLLRKRRNEIREWMESLEPNHVYILCCWENTLLKAKCHRQILYEAFKNSSMAKEKIIPFYCSGDKKMDTNVAISPDHLNPQGFSPRIDNAPFVPAGSLVYVTANDTVTTSGTPYDTYASYAMPLARRRPR